MSKYRNLIISIIFAIAVSGCGSLGYYAQSINGQLEILHKRQPIDKLLKHHDLPRDIKAQLELSRQIRDFAIMELGLPDNGSYRDYADLGRDFVVWNVFATPELSLQNRQWCYLIVGCLAYRGYFSEENAREYALQLENGGYDVYVGGVTAYSTLGWFDDPVLNTMLQRGDIYLARVIFHELAHQKVYIKDDTEINEAFADTVAETGVHRWLESSNPSGYAPAQIENMQQEEDQFVELVLKYRNQLDELYNSAITDSQKRARKSMLLGRMIDEYRKMYPDNSIQTRYGSWFATGLNNAKLMAVVTYRKYMPGFRKMLLAVDNDFEAFYELADRLRHCSHDQRRDILQSGKIHFSCPSG
jgi:predicted aminopeptidase